MTPGTGPCNCHGDSERVLFVCTCFSISCRSLIRPSGSAFRTRGCRGDIVCRDPLFYATVWIRGGFQKSMTGPECVVFKTFRHIVFCIGCCLVSRRLCNAELLVRRQRPGRISARAPWTGDDPSDREYHSSDATSSWTPRQPPPSQSSQPPLGPGASCPAACSAATPQLTESESPCS